MDGGLGEVRAVERRRWWLLFVLLIVAASAWSLGAPLMTGHDESGQAVRSAAAARGELLGTAVPGFKPDNGLVGVHAPEAYRHADAAGACFLGEPYERFPGMLPTPPDRGPCVSLSGGHDEVVVTTNQHRNPPLYSVLIGLPTRVFPAQLGAYLMRLVGVVVCAALLASALVTVHRFANPRLAALGALAALTPEIVYLAGTSNSAGPETAASFSLWTGGLALAVAPAPPDATLVRRAGVALAVLAVARPVSPGFALVAIVVCALLADRDRRRALVARPDVRGWLIAGVLAAATTGAWIAHLQREMPMNPLEGTGLAEGIGRVGWWMRGVVGVFGSTDVIPPAGLHVLWGTVALAAVGWSLRRARLRDALASGGLALSAVTLLVSGEGLGFPATGYWWQGRYVLPLLIGAVVTASVTARNRSRRRSPTVDNAHDPLVRLAGLMLVAVLVALHVWAYLYATRHYAVGYGGTPNPLKYLFDPSWSPPYGPAVLFAALFAVAIAALAAVVWRSVPATSIVDASSGAGTPRPQAGSEVASASIPEPARR